MPHLDCLSSPFLKTIIGIRSTELMRSPSPSAKLDSFDHKYKLENDFCKDFACCGLRLDNLHQLLEHYEEFHLMLNNNNDNLTIVSNEESVKRRRLLSEEDTLLPMNLAFLPRPLSIKEHITGNDLNLLENASMLSNRQIAQSLDSSIVDRLNTPCLSPTPGSSSSHELLSDEDHSSSSTSSDAAWTSRSTNLNSMYQDDDRSDKPYRCLVPECDKAYKNANGLKYHRLHGHCPPSENNEFLETHKPFICSLEACQKRYKNLNGLKYHIEHTHMMKVANLTSDVFVSAKGELLNPSLDEYLVLDDSVVPKADVVVEEEKEEEEEEEEETSNDDPFSFSAPVLRSHGRKRRLSSMTLQ